MAKAYLDVNKPKRSQFREKRREAVSGVIVIHTAENEADLVGADSGAENVAKFIQNRTDPGSYHRLVDSDSIVKLVRLGCEAYGDGTGSNPHAIHLSVAVRTVDWAKMSKSKRTEYIANLAKAANEARKWLKNKHNITVPAKRISRAESEKRLPGFIGHGDRDPGRRSDPGADFPWDEFLAAYVALSKPTKVIKNPSSSKNTKAKKAQKTRRIILRAEKRGTKDKVITKAQLRKLKSVRVALRFK